MFKHLCISLIVLSSSFYCIAQSTLVTKTIDGESGKPVISTITIRPTNKAISTDSLGIGIIEFLANGKFNLQVSAVGYKEKEFSITIPSPVDTLELILAREEHEMEEVVVQSTRTSRTIANVPTRIETIALEEIDEKNNMRPGNVAMLLHESTGIQVQQTSATSGNASIRIQGLDGRYTQLLKDGFANFGNFSSGLSVLEIPPLDLKQVEIIKGPASPLFGGGAIAGVINFISKTPTPKPEYSCLLNHSHIGQSNFGAFTSQKFKKVGYTLLALYNHQQPFDVDDDDFTEVPKSNELTIHPRFFIYPDESTVIQIATSFTNGERQGGDIVAIRGKADTLHQYIEMNKTKRNILTFELDKKMGAYKRFVARQSFSVFDRKINLPDYSFNGTEYTGYSDISYIASRDKHALVLGGNFNYTDFREKKDSSANRNNRMITGGVYGQHTLDITNNIKLETGLRLDLTHYSNSIFSEAEFFVLPRVSLLVKYNEHWSSRIGMGMGYKTPTIFTEETETIHYKDVEQLNNVISEESYGATTDINWRTPIGDQFALTFNQMFFYTIISHPLVLETDPFGKHKFVNASKNIQSGGFEANARLIYKQHLKLFLGYTFTHARATYLSGNDFMPLVPKHKLNTALVFEKEGVIKLGLEGYFTGRQYLSDGTITPSFDEFGFMAEKIFRRFSLFINFENFTDTRQSRYKPVVSGSHLDPVFDEIWTHTEGFVVNGGVKIKL